MRRFALALLWTATLALVGVGTSFGQALPACDGPALSPGDDIAAALGTGGTAWDPKVVCLKPGTYYLYQNLEMPSHSELRGFQGTPTLQSYADRNVVAVNKTGVTLRQLRIRGTWWVSTYNVLLFQTTNARIEDCILEHSGSINLGISGGANHTIVGNTLRLQGFKSTLPNPAIWGTNTSGVEVRDNYVVGRNNGPGGDGEVAFHNSSNIQILDNDMENIGASCVYLVNTSNATVSGNDLENCGEWGIDLVQGTNNVSVHDNWVYGSYFGAAVVSDTCLPTQQSNIQFSYNTMISTNSSGVGTCDCINVELSSSPGITSFGDYCGSGFEEKICNYVPACN